MSRRILYTLIATGLALLAAVFMAPAAHAQLSPEERLQYHAESLALWAENGPVDYEFEYSASCSECPEFPDVRVTVNDGAVVAIETIDGSDTLIPDELQVTVDDLFGLIGTALESSLTDDQVRYDSRYGYPHFFQTSSNAPLVVEGEAEFVILDLRSLDPWPEVQAALDAARAQFTLTTYSYESDVICFCVVGPPVAVQFVDGELEWTTGEPEFARTVPELFDEIQEAITDDVDDLRVSFDPDLGYPIGYSVDPVLDLFDDEYAVFITSFAEGVRSEPVTCEGWLVTVDIGAGDVATGGRDIILGTAGPDVINGLSGDDIICGLGGRDTIYGGPGNDEIYAGGGHDVVWAGPGYDRVYGQPGADEIHGGDRDDYLFGGSGFDTIYGDAGNDFVQGSGGDDMLYGGTGDDKLYGKAGADRMWGGSGSDELYAAGGDDHAWGEAGNDRIQGAAGNDTLEGGDDVDTLYGQAGNDTLLGGAADDVLYGAAGDDVLEGGDGDDNLQGAAGNDTLRGGAGVDVLYGQAGNDDLDGGAGANECWPGSGTNVVVNC